MTCKMGSKNVLLLFTFTMFFLLLNIALAAPSTDELTSQCAPELQKVVGCLSFASGKAPVPPKECCDSVSDMKESKPVCLCFIIAQAHNGSEQLKSMGIQEAKLLELPSACKLKNASVGDCPKLLGIASNSPAAAVFSDSNSSNSTPATPTLHKETSPSQSHSSNGPKLQNHTAFPGFVAFLIYLCLYG